MRRRRAREHGHPLNPLLSFAPRPGREAKAARSTPTHSLSLTSRPDHLSLLTRYGTAAHLASIRPALTLDPARDDPARPWEPLITDFDAGNGLTFSAWRRTGGPGPGGTEYRMAGLQAGAAAEAQLDFFLDDAARAGWDTLLSGFELLEGREEVEAGSSSFHARRQVVVWSRKFKVPFLGPREYVIARQAWAEGEEGEEGEERGSNAQTTAPGGGGGGQAAGRVAAVMLAQATHAAKPEPNPGAVRVPAMWSAWASRTVRPGEPGHPGEAAAHAVSAFLGCDRSAAAAAPACETVMVRRESYALPDAVARPVVRGELPAYAERMGKGWAAFARARAARGLGLEEVDREAYCKRAT